MICETPLEWKRRSCQRGCLLHDDASDCEGPLESHHVITQQALRKRGLSHLAWDIRNSFSVCERGHRRHTLAVGRIPRNRLPAEAFEFADEHGLGWMIERYYPLSGDTENPGSKA